jgi:hypothetical protein
LTDVSYPAGRMEYVSKHESLPEAALAEHLADARRILDEAERVPPPRCEALRLSDSFERLRWFPLPSESGADGD